jgi:hypothetical protein
VVSLNDRRTAEPDAKSVQLCCRERRIAVSHLNRDGLPDRIESLRIPTGSFIFNWKNVRLSNTPPEQVVRFYGGCAGAEIIQTGGGSVRCTSRQKISNADAQAFAAPEALQMASGSSTAFEHVLGSC